MNADLSAAVWRERVQRETDILGGNLAIYEKPVRLLMKEMVDALCRQPGQTFTRQQAVEWFKQAYPRIKEGTITCHLTRFSTNALSRFHYSAKPRDEDVLFQIDRGRYRRYDPSTDPIPLAKPSEAGEGGIVDDGDNDNDDCDSTGQFAYEHDLRDYLARNLQVIESGLRLYEEEDGITGIEFPAGNRFIDILALDRANNFVIIELKVSRGYDRVVGQLLRYMSWIEQHQAEPTQSVRGIIVAREISDDLKLACRKVADVAMFEYQMSVTLKPVTTARKS